MSDKDDSVKKEEMEEILKDLENESAKGDKMHHNDKHRNMETDSETQEENKQSKKAEDQEKRSSKDDKESGKAEDEKECTADIEEGSEKKSEADKKEKAEDKKDNKKDPKQDKIDELNDRVMRQMAEFDNYRKRTEKEKDGMFDAGARSVIEKILPIVDNFERGIKTVTDEEKDGAFAKGIVMIYKQLSDELDKMGVKPIEAVGKPFDPNFHNAVMQVDSEEYDTGTVAQELQKGYTYHDTVIRHSMVAVVK